MNNTKTRKQRRQSRHDAAAQIMPPEGVPLRLDIAGVGVRMVAQITDVLITLGFAGSILIILSVSGAIGTSTILALGSLLFFAIRIPYYILSELAWNGQTIGKRLMKIKVVSHTGGSLTTHALVLRNIMKEAEVFLPGTLVLTLQQDNSIASWISFIWVMMAFAIPLTNPHRMRLGDMLAGTHVVHLPHPILLSDLARENPAPVATDQTGFTFLSHQLDHYGRFELQTLESFLRAQEKGTTRQNHQSNTQTLAAIVERIRKKIGYAEAISKVDHLPFLQAFYNAQRAYLEQRQLFGDRRSDKHFAANDEAK
ncbi:RDD family protein [Tateyamaria sp.]|uniref:RDD family protein n=1 Tax=Tateyamaria sp. TaxID=1929288 RepID=UPI00329CA445